MKETQENIPPSNFKSPQKSFFQAQVVLSVFFPSVTFFLWGQNIKLSIRTCGPPKREEESSLFSLKNIKTTPRNSFHKSCRHTGTRNRHPKTKSLSKNYQRGNQTLTYERIQVSAWMFVTSSPSDQHVSKLKLHLVISCMGKKVRLGGEIKENSQ